MAFLTPDKKQANLKVKFQLVCCARQVSLNWDSTEQYNRSVAVADLGEGPLFLEQTEARRTEKMFFWDRVSPSYQGLDDCPPPPTPIWMSASATVDSKVKIFLVDTFDVFDKLLHFMD